jgi:hypothetical protein
VGNAVVVVVVVVVRNGANLRESWSGVGRNTAGKPGNKKLAVQSRAGSEEM